jgi:hypothetical protein
VPLHACEGLARIEAPDGHDLRADVETRAGSPLCRPPAWNQGVVFRVLSDGSIGSWTMTSSARRMLFTLFSGIPFGWPVVPDV